jgi:serine protease Do
MKKFVIGAVAIATLVIAAFMLAPQASAQRDRLFTQRQFDGLVLEGPGSSIGVSVRELSADDAARTKVQQSEGVYIEDVRDGTPAARAGLKSGDVVVDFDGERPRSTRHFTRLVRETAPGRTVKMTIMRDGARLTLDITPDARGTFGSVPDAVTRAIPRDFQFNFDGQLFNLWDGPFGTSGRLGVVVVPMSDQLADYFGVKDGVLVSEVRASTPAAAAGLKAGDVITAVNGRVVMSPQDVVNEIRDVKPGGAVDLRVMRDRKELTLKAMFPERGRQTAGGLTI